MDTLEIKLSNNGNHIIFIKDKEEDKDTGLLTDKVIGIREIAPSVTDKQALVEKIKLMKVSFDGRPDQNGFTRVKIA